MLSRQEFFRDLLFRDARALGEFAGEAETVPARPGNQVPDFDLAATELSPALLAIEAECRGIDPQGGGDEL